MTVNTQGLTIEQLTAKMKAMQKELDKANGIIKAKCRVTFNAEKGTIYVYHGGRFPTTLYADQWVLVLSMAETITDNKDLIEDLKKAFQDAKQNVKAVG